MIVFAEINGIKRPFKFGMREIFKLSQQMEGVDSESPTETLAKVSLDLDLFLEIFVMAGRKGSRIHLQETGEDIQAVDSIELEDALDNDFGLLERLTAMMNESVEVKNEDTGTPQKNVNG